MSESVVRLERRRGFTVVQNEMLRDSRLSLKTKGLFAVMLSKPGDWEFSVSGLAHSNGVGRDAIRSSLVELEKAGYLVREKQAHGERGKFAGNVYILHEESCLPLPENPTAAEKVPSPENPATVDGAGFTARPGQRKGGEQAIWGLGGAAASTTQSVSTPSRWYPADCAPCAGSMRFWPVSGT